MLVVRASAKPGFLDSHGQTTEASCACVVHSEPAVAAASRFRGSKLTSALPESEPVFKGSWRRILDHEKPGRPKQQSFGSRV